MTDARRVQHPQGAIPRRHTAPGDRAGGWQGSGASHQAGESKSGAGKAMRKRGAREFRRAVSDRRRGCFRRYGFIG